MKQRRPLYKPHDSPTRRGWLFLGENGGRCDKACKFCYYAHQPDLVFYTLDTVLMVANRFRHVYELEHCDISGGEPTIYPKIENVVEHCANIGLKPTLITHGQNNNEEQVRELEDAGLDDWLVSMHGLSESHDAAVTDRRGRGAGGWQRLVDGLTHCRRPVRFNTTLTAYNYGDLVGVAEWLVEHREPTVWNMIQFNPFHAWGANEVIEFQVPMKTLAPHMAEALQIAESAGWEVNVRYFPFCVAAEYGFERNCINYYQTQYDPHEWGLEATSRLPKQQIHEGGGAEPVRRALCDHVRASRDNPACRQCRFHSICEGPTEQYQRRYGLDELRPVPGPAVEDVLYFERPGATWPAQAARPERNHAAPPPKSLDARATTVDEILERFHLHYADEQLDEAAECLRQALAVAPTCVEALAAFGSFSLHLGDREAAQLALSEIRRVDPQHPSAATLTEALT